MLQPDSLFSLPPESLSDPPGSSTAGCQIIWLGVVLAQLVPPAVNSSVLVISAAALGLSKANSVKKEEGTVCA